jgi:pyruvate/2-oxoglutarate/acetoin dehydrogenase E1 component/TPP-dependent pyruvate/acetoin dehydrogenase alpha subunit
MPENLTIDVSLDTPSGAVLSDNSLTDMAHFVKRVLKDYEICVLSRELSLVGRKEVLTGKAKFGIFGDGKELPQVALAHALKNGDWRSGYYRDQTLMFSLGVSTPEDFFAQLYADHDNDPFSGGRQMNAHFVTPNIDKSTGEWINTRDQFNTASDISSTAGQMARALGLALASKKYREVAQLRNSTKFSDNGNEVVVCTIGDASTSEGAFWETVNAAAVMRVPLAIFIWDDAYGISVPAKFQTTKENISEILSGFALDEHGNGLNIHTVNGWDYPNMCDVFERGIDNIRKTHIPAIFHVREITQPQGHSTSGSHERYKTRERLEWERQFDCNTVMRLWIIQSGFATEEELQTLEIRAKAQAREARNKAWNNYSAPIAIEKNELLTLAEHLATAHVEAASSIQVFQKEIKAMREPFLSEMMKEARRLIFELKDANSQALDKLKTWVETHKAVAKNRYSTHLYSTSRYSALSVPVVHPTFSTDSVVKNGYEIINTFFDRAFEHIPNAFAFGEDVGKIGDVNQGFMGLQDKYGIERIFDCGIREWTIMGQAIGMSMRGLRPIAEIQYLDYLLYGLTPLSDDLATLRYRSNGVQQAPAIIRTRGHRLEGIWHAGSPMGMMLGSLRGMYLCVPRNFVQAAGMYNTLLQSDDPAIVVECLNGYRLKETMPDNIGEFTVPLGVPEVLVEGSDVTLVTYGSCVRVAQEAAVMLKNLGVSIELIDVQTLLPFDLENGIVASLKKTNRLVLLDEDVPGGATAYMLQDVLQRQGGYRFLDAAPLCISAKEHRPPYGSDGDYFSKPNAEDIVEAVLKLMAF